VWIPCRPRDVAGRWTERRTSAAAHGTVATARILRQRPHELLQRVADQSECGVGHHLLAGQPADEHAVALHRQSGIGDAGHEHAAAGSASMIGTHREAPHS